MGFLRRHRLAEGLLLGALLGHRRRRVVVVRRTVRLRTGGVPKAAAPSGRGGCAALIGVAMLVGLVVAYWYVVLPLVAVVTLAVVLARHHRSA